MDAENRTRTDYMYTTISGGGVMIHGYCGEHENLCIPAAIDGSPVIQIGPYAFSDNLAIREIVIPEGIREIESNAFENCTSLCCVAIPETVTMIGESAFAGCSSLQSVILPSGVRDLADQTFAYCGSLGSVVLPDGLKHIGCNAFEECTSLTQIYLPDSVETIDNEAFSGCSALKNCNIPNNMEYMGYRVFSGCGDLVLSLVPGCFREGFAEYCQLPFTPREDIVDDPCYHSSVGILRDALYEIVSHYENYHRLAGELPNLPLTVGMERPAPWKKEKGHWVANPGFLRTIWSYRFPDNYVRTHLKEALTRAFFHPEAKISVPEVTDVTLVMEDSRAVSKFPQLRLQGNTDILCVNPDAKYGDVTIWIAVADSQIAIAEEFWYD